MVIRYALVAALGGLLFGFDIAIITGAGPFLTDAFQLNSLQEGWAYSSLLFGAIAGAAAAGRISDRIGRKSVLTIVALIFAMTSLWSALATGFTSLVLARIFGGLAVGAVSAVSPIYISEIAPPKRRGSLVSTYQLFIVSGILISYLINYLLHDIGDNNWRWMFATGIFPSLLFLILLMMVSETPRFLFLKGREEQAEHVMIKLMGKKQAEIAMHEMLASRHQEKVSFKALLNPSLKRVILVGFVFAILVQLSGINTVIDYAPKIFAEAGWGLDAGLFATFGLGIINFLCTLISIMIIDRFGRRPMYLIGSSGMFLTLALLAHAGFTDRFEGVYVLVLIALFLFFFAAFIGPVFWTYMSEIFPNHVRGTAMSVPTFTQWIFNALVVLLFPAMLSKLNTGFSFGLLALFALSQLLFSFKYMKETRGKSLEEIEQEWVESRQD